MLIQFARGVKRPLTQPRARIRHFVGFGDDPFGEANKNIPASITQVAGVGTISNAHVPSHESALAWQSSASYFQGMKNHARWLLIFCGLALSSPGLFGQDSVQTADLIVARQEWDERFKRLESAVESLQASQERQQKRLAAVAEEIQRLREEMARKPNEAVSRDELRSLEKKVVELNDKREADKRLILEQLEKLANTPPAVPAAPSKTTKPSLNPDQPGFEYVVESGEILSTIVRDFNAEFKKKGLKGTLTVDQVLKANQMKKATDLRAGQRLFIPDPSAKP
jgi:LysM repeat protein